MWATETKAAQFDTWEPVNKDNHQIKQPVNTHSQAKVLDLQQLPYFKFTKELFLKLKALPKKGPHGPIPEDADL